MKADVRIQARAEVRQKMLHWSGIPAVEQALRALLAMAAGFALAGVRVSGTVLPLPICLASVLGLSAASFGAYVGGCLGYLVFYPFQAVESMAAGLLVQAGLCIFGDQLTEDDRWFCVGSAAGFTALVGFLFLLEQRFAARMIWRYALRVLTAGAGTWCFHAALRDRHPLCCLILPVCLCAGLCAIVPVGMPLGAAAACAVAASCLSLPVSVLAAALCGVAMDLMWAPGCATGVLVLAALVACRGKRLLRLGLWMSAILLGILLTGTDARLLAAAFLGGGASLLLRADKLFGTAQTEKPGRDPRLGAAAGLLHRLGKCLMQPQQGRPDPEMATVFDRAADKVCRMCGEWDRCWNENAVRTVKELELAAPAMMARGRAVKTDLPEPFAARCCHVDGFLTAINRELDDLSCRRRCRSRIKESRLVLAHQYTVLADALVRERKDPGRRVRYCPEVGFCSKEAQAQAVCGDRGVTFRVGTDFYLILCDGMGCGAEAEGEAGTAIAILRTLLQAGVSPIDAMEVLNGIYILRDDGAFATVDLICADLITGETELLKWGAAPSYLKQKNSLEKIGTASPPPGIGVGEEYRPQVQKLSLARGELLVLLTDGAVGERTERFLRQYPGASPKELAAGIISSQCSAEDDRTAVVLALRTKRP